MLAPVGDQMHRPPLRPTASGSTSTLRLPLNHSAVPVRYYCWHLRLTSTSASYSTPARFAPSVLAHSGGGGGGGGSGSGSRRRLLLLHIRRKRIVDTRAH